ncbi:MAG: type II toxin-antitoxin system RelE/ParE family toxin [Steroidobacteraceae bacterium]|nr:type II toxin-antitoxin system RelE/ParE family toxin [Steroidobacteraceae bacterium]
MEANDVRQAGRWLEKLRRRALQLGEMPYAFPLAKLPAAPGIRARPVDAYMIYYRVREDEVQILRVVHAARDAGALSLDG